MLNIAMPQVVLNGARIGVLVGQVKAAGVPQHMRMGREAQAGDLTRERYELGKARCRERRASLAREHERRLGILLALQLAQRPEFVTLDWIRARSALLDPTNMQTGPIKIHLIPA